MTYEVWITFAEGPGRLARAIALVGARPIGTGVFLPTRTRDAQFVFATERDARDARDRVIAGMVLKSSMVYPSTE